VQPEQLSEVVVVVHDEDVGSHGEGLLVLVARLERATY
jgi:hypothetical protein